MLYLKHLLRGVGLGLFDEAGAMEKFTAWTSDHDSNVTRRQGAHKKGRTDKRDQPVVKKVEAKVEVAPAAEPVEAPVAEPVEAAVEAPASEETKTEE